MAHRPDVRYIQYNAGSAAPKLQPLPKRREAPLPKKRPRVSYTILVDPLALTGIVLAVVMLVLMLVGWSHLSAARQELAQTRQQVEQLRQQTAAAEAEYRQKVDLELVEAAALGMGMVPMEQVQHIQVAIAPYAEPEPTAWEKITAFLVSFFA